MHWQPAERRNEANCRRPLRPVRSRCDGGYVMAAQPNNGTGGGRRPGVPRQALTSQQRRRGVCGRRRFGRDISIFDSHLPAQTRALARGAGVATREQAETPQVGQIARVVLVVLPFLEIANGVATLATGSLLFCHHQPSFRGQLYANPLCVVRDTQQNQISSTTLYTFRPDSTLHG